MQLLRLCFIFFEQQWDIVFLTCHKMASFSISALSSIRFLRLCFLWSQRSLTTKVGRKKSLFSIVFSVYFFQSLTVSSVSSRWSVMRPLSLCDLIFWSIWSMVSHISLIPASYAMSRTCFIPTKNTVSWNFGDLIEDWRPLCSYKRWF